MWRKVRGKKLLSFAAVLDQVFRVRISMSKASIIINCIKLENSDVYVSGQLTTLREELNRGGASFLSSSFILQFLIIVVSLDPALKLFFRSRSIDKIIGP